MGGGISHPNQAALLNEWLPSRDLSMRGRQLQGDPGEVPKAGTVVVEPGCSGWVAVSNGHIAESEWCRGVGGNRLYRPCPFMC